MFPPDRPIVDCLLRPPAAAPLPPLARQKLEVDAGSAGVKVKLCCSLTFSSTRPAKSSPGLRPAEAPPPDRQPLRLAVR